MITVADEYAREIQPENKIINKMALMQKILPCFHISSILILKFSLKFCLFTFFSL
jgi:hypothetical protein